ncbi:MAG: pyridoxamine 5'-phosphate oxidase family protein [Pseudomonadota bacterium]
MFDAREVFHEGELEAQRRTGAGDMTSFASAIIRDYMPDQHRAFFSAQPFLVFSGADADGRVWTTLIEGPDGFVGSPDNRTLTLATEVDEQDPLAAAFASGTDVGMVGIELATRRRNRLSGAIRPEGAGYVVDLNMSFGNCPQYINERAWRRVERTAAAAKTSASLSAEQIALVKAADTLFIGSGHYGEEGAPANGFDASHRGGEPGFAQVEGGTRIRIPDYAGNNAFNTIGNLLRNPQVGLVFVDFETGGLLHVSGTATIDWEAKGANDPAARRTIDIEIEAVVERPGALSLRWTREEALRQFKVTRKVREADGVASFYLAPVDGGPLDPFEPGQHLPIQLRFQNAAPAKRTYSLSGAPGAAEYRLTVKREDKGLVSRALHDAIEVGHVIEARPPSGDFVVGCSQCPLVLASAGVGLTPMVSMLHKAAADGGDRPVWYAHGARDGAHHALAEEVDALVASRPSLHRHIRFSSPRAEDSLGEDYDAPGRVTAEALLALNAGPDAHYMLCGPAAFIADIQSGLAAAGVPQDQIHWETFGPTG